MAEKKKNEVMAVADQETLAALAAAFPEESGFQRTFYDRLAFTSQDVTEKTKDPVTKKPKIEVVTPAGTFSIQKPTGEKVKNADGKEVIGWSNEELGDEIEGIIVYKRNQLKMFDDASGSFTSSNVYDSSEDVVKLFENGKEIAKGTPAELKARYEYTDERTGKKRSKLEDNAILFVLYDGQILQLNIRGTSMYSFLTYRRTVAPNTVLTRFSSTEEENGATRWNKMAFEKVRYITQEESELVKEASARIAGEIADEKRYFGTRDGAIDAVATPSGDAGFGEFEAHIAR